MAQKTLEKLNRNISNLKGEIKNLRSFVIGIAGKDKEGEYKPEFVKRVFKNSKKQKDFTFKNAESFLKNLKRYK